MAGGGGGIGAAGNFTTEVKPGGAPTGVGGSDLTVAPLPSPPAQPAVSPSPQTQQQTAQYQPQYQQMVQPQPQMQQPYQPDMGLQNLYSMFMNAMQAGGLNNLYGAGTFNRPRAPMQPYVGSTYRPDMTSAYAKLKDVAPSVATEQARAAAEEARQNALSVLSGGGGE